MQGYTLESLWVKLRNMYPVIWKGERNKTKYFTAYQLHSPKEV